MTYDQFYKKYPKVKSDMNRVKFNENYRFTDNSIPDYNQIKNIWGEFDPKRYIPLGVQDAYESSYMFYDTKTGDYVNVWSDIEEPERIKRLDDSSKGVSKEFISRVKPKGISGAIKEYKNASKTVEKERSASNNAIKLLKDVGVKGKELKRAEKELNESLKTYKLSRSKKVLEALNRGLDDLTPSEKERLKINRENKIENLKRSIKSVFKKK
jgi:hypothetical protein